MNPRCLKVIENVKCRNVKKDGRHGHHGRQGHHGHQDHNGWVVLKNKLLLKEEHWKGRRNLRGRCKRQFDHSLFLDAVFTTIPHKHPETWCKKRTKCDLLSFFQIQKQAKILVYQWLWKLRPVVNIQLPSPEKALTSRVTSSNLPASADILFEAQAHPLIHSKYCWLICTSTCQGKGGATKSDEFSEKFQRGEGGSFSIQKLILQILDL